MASAYDLICKCLQEAGFVRRPSPLRVERLELSFDTVFEGPADSHELVLVVDLEKTWLTKLEHQLRAFFIALERVGSNRLVSVVVLDSSQDGAAQVDALSQLCRVLRVPTRSNAQDVADLLGPLLPLGLPQPSEPVSAVDRQLRKAVKMFPDSDARSGLLRASRAGSAAVENVFLEWLEGQLDQARRQHEDEGAGGTE